MTGWTAGATVRPRDNRDCMIRTIDSILRCRTLPAAHRCSLLRARPRCRRARYPSVAAVVGDKILFVCSGLNIGGAERQWSQLIPALRDRGYNVTVLTLVDEGPFFEELRLRGIDVRCARMRHRLDVIGLIRALRQHKLRPAVVVTHSTNAHVVGHLIARKVGSPHVTTEHLNVGPGTPRAWHREALARIVGPRVDCAIAISQRQVPRLLKLGYRRDRIRIIAERRPRDRGLHIGVFGEIATWHGTRRFLGGPRRDSSPGKGSCFLRPRGSTGARKRTPSERCHRRGWPGIRAREGARGRGSRSFA